MSPSRGISLRVGSNLAAARPSRTNFLLSSTTTTSSPGLPRRDRAPLTEDRGWGAWQRSSPTAGRILNTLGARSLHRDRLGGGRPSALRRADGPAVAFASGAAWPSGARLGRARRLQRSVLPLPRGCRPRPPALAGGHRVGIEPRALCDHDTISPRDHKVAYLSEPWATSQDLSASCCCCGAGADRHGVALLAVAVRGAGSARSSGPTQSRPLVAALLRSGGRSRRAARRDAAFARACLTRTSTAITSGGRAARRSCARCSAPTGRRSSASSRRIGRDLHRYPEQISANQRVRPRQPGPGPARAPAPGPRPRSSPGESASRRAPPRGRPRGRRGCARG